MNDQKNAQVFLDKFRIIKCLNKDSNTAVYIAHHIYLDKKIFLKTLDSENLTNPNLLKRFEREAKTLARLDHPNIIKIYDFGTWKSIYYISFEYFESNNLRYLLSNPPLSDERKTAIIRQIVLGLYAAHCHKIVHRDIKPENILINEKFQVKIADFGLALFNDADNATHPSSIVGTPAYMSPEQIRGEKLTCASDFFSLGIIIFELNGLKNPFLGQDVGQTLNNILNVNIEDYEKQLKDFSAENAQLVKELLQRDVLTREKSAGVLLKPWLDHENQSAETKTDSPKTFLGIKLTLTAFAIVLIPVLIYLMMNLIPKNQAVTEQSLSDKIEIKTSVDTLDQEPLSANSPKKENKTTRIETNEISGGNKDISQAEEAVGNHSLLLPGHLIVECRPWAYVYLDSILVDSTPLSTPIKLTSGGHSLILKHPEYPDYIQRVFINSNEESIVSVDLDNLIGYLDCKIFPWGDIFIDNNLMGQSPLEKLIRLFPGTYELTIKNTGYHPFTRSITMDDGDTLCVEYDFVAKMANAKKE